MPGGKREEPIEKPVDPGRTFATFGSGQFRGQTKGEESSHRPGTHGRNVAQATREGAVTDCFGWVQFELEMATFNRQISGDGRLLAGLEAKKGAIVSNSKT